MEGSPFLLQTSTTITTCCKCFAKAKATLKPPFRTKFLVPYSPHLLFSSLSPAALKSPKGFGPKTPKEEKKNRRKGFFDEEEEDDEEEEGDERDVAIPEVVTNRMMKRVGLSVGIPLTAGLLFFPLFYYLKKVAKIDVPNWIPFLVSFIFFGTALLGVSYGIVSASWDPLREGSFLGWNKARRNWPVFWDSLRGKQDQQVK